MKEEAQPVPKLSDQIAPHLLKNERGTTREGAARFGLRVSAVSDICPRCPCVPRPPSPAAAGTRSPACSLRTAPQWCRLAPSAP